MQHGQRQEFEDRTNKPICVTSPISGDTLYDMGKHLIGRQFKRKEKVIIPNCALIIPQRYKKGYEETVRKNDKKMMRQKSLVQRKDWVPGGKTVQKT